MSPLRKRLEHSRLLASVLARIAGSYLRLCNATTKWRIVGLEDLKTDLADGPVLSVMWHERSLMGPVHWPVKTGQLSSLYDKSAIGRVSGAMQRQFGLQPMEMSHKASNVTASRQILHRVRDGISIGMTGDGPLGPALQLKDAPLDWARVMQRPVYGYAFATKRHRRLKAWDKMMMPLPFTSGVIVFSKWSETPERKAPNDGLRDAMQQHLDNTSQTADARLP